MAINDAARGPRGARGPAPATAEVGVTAAARTAVGATGLEHLPPGSAFRLLVDAVVDYAIFLISPDGRVLSWNRGAERIKGYGAEEIIGRHISVFYTPEDALAGRPERNLESAVAHGHFTEQAWRVRRDGTRFWADVVVTPLRDERGQLVGFAKVTRDLTERRAAEERDRQLALEREARLAAEEALRARERFLSIASHELRTPVASLQLAVDALTIRRQRGTLDEERLGDLLHRMERAIGRMTSLLGELLDVSRLSNDEASLSIGPVDLAELVEDVVDRFTDLGRPGRRRITLDLAPVSVEGDANRIDQVVCNLVDNALKYSDDDDPVEVTLRGTAEGALLEVTDSGRGLEMGGVEVFQPFGRGANVRDRQGLGLGLFIARQIVERHGGTITAENRAAARGATFRVSLPSHPHARPDG